MTNTDYINIHAGPIDSNLYEMFYQRAMEIDELKKKLQTINEKAPESECFEK